MLMPERYRSVNRKSRWNNFEMKNEHLMQLIQVLATVFWPVSTGKVGSQTWTDSMMWHIFTMLREWVRQTSATIYNRLRVRRMLKLWPFSTGCVCVRVCVCGFAQFIYYRIGISSHMRYGRHYCNIITHIITNNHNKPNKMHAMWTRVMPEKKMVRR